MEVIKKLDIELPTTYSITSELESSLQELKDETKKLVDGINLRNNQLYNKLVDDEYKYESEIEHIYVRFRQLESELYNFKLDLYFGLGGCALLLILNTLLGLDIL